MADLFIEKKNEVYLSIKGEECILRELQDCFSFYADGYKFHKLYKIRAWDGMVRLLKLVSRTRGELYYGLLFEVIKICKARGYTIELDNSIKQRDQVNIEDLHEYVANLEVSSKQELITPRDYQVKGFAEGIINQRNLCLSVTSSGKSLIIYLLTRYLNEQGLKGLIIVPNLNLIHQMYSDFQDYSGINRWCVQKNVHKIFSGQDKESDKSIYLSTWQSLQNIKENYQTPYFNSFDYVIIDECHGIKATQLTKILEKCTKAKYRYGFTGTVDNVKANINTIIGLTGSINKLNTTKELIDRKEISNVNIKCLVLKHDKDTCKLMRKAKYQDEIKYLVSNTKRNIFIKNLALSTKTNTIVLFNFVETHGKKLYELIKNSKHAKDRKVFFIHGGIDGEEREAIRHIVEKEQDAIIVASFGTMSTGTNIKNLHNIIFAISSKSSIRVLQSIGRSLRLHDTKDVATIYDLSDHMYTGKVPNHTMNHLLARVKIYNKEKLDYKIINVPFDNTPLDTSKTL